MWPAQGLIGHVSVKFLKWTIIPYNSAECLPVPFYSMLKEYFFPYKVKIDVFPRIENFLRVINCDLEEGERGEQWGIIFKPGFPVWLLRQGSFFITQLMVPVMVFNVMLTLLALKRLLSNVDRVCAKTVGKAMEHTAKVNLISWFCFPSLMLPIYKIDSDTFRQFFFQRDTYLPGNFTAFFQLSMGKS